jgi:hypothetical protein
MSRSLSNWNSWDLLDKATFYAQVAAILTLLGTSVFSYLGLREARETRLDQAAYFLAEKAPDVRLVSVDFGPKYVAFQLTNQGESVAKSITYHVKLSGGFDHHEPLPPPPIDSSLMPPPALVEALNKGKSEELTGPDMDEVVKVATFTPKTFRLVDLTAGQRFNYRPPRIEVSIHFDDLVRNHYTNSYVIELSDK